MFFKKACISGGSTNDLNTDKGEVGGSSPPKPTIQITSKYVTILTFPFRGISLKKPMNFEQCDSPSNPRRPPPDMLRDCIGRFLRDRSDTARSGKTGASNLPGKRESQEGTELYPAALIEVAPWRTLYVKSAVLAGNRNPYKQDPNGLHFAIRDTPVS